MADTSVKLSGTYDSVEAYNIMVEMQNMSADYEEIRTEAAAAASAATAASTAATNAVNTANAAVANAQTYAGNANTSAGEAAGYASDASTAATNAATSETNASNSASAAATSAANAAASEAIVVGALPLSGGTITGNLEVNGNLTQAGKTVEKINSSGSNYIRYESGVQICWGKTSNLSSANADTYTDITLPVAFANTDYSVSLTTYIVSGGWNSHSFAIANKTTTSMRAQLRNLNSTAYVCYFMWIAIGKWK